MKTALCTLLDDNFVIGFKAFVKSLKKWHPEVNYDFLIIDVGLSDENKSYMKLCYDNLVFIKPDYKNYSDVNMSKTSDVLKKTYYTLELFSFEAYERIIFFDMDMVITGDISEVLNCKEDFAAVKGYNAKADEMRGDINSGMFVVGEKYLNQATYRALLNIAKKGFSMPDQKTINIYFKDKMKYFNKRYNVEKRMISTQKYKHITDDIRILHFIARKPWQPVVAEDDKFEPYRKIWEYYYNLEI